MSLEKGSPRLQNESIIVLLWFIIGSSSMAPQVFGSEGITAQQPSFLYTAWTEPVAGGMPVVSHSIYLANDGALQYARFTDRGDLLKLERGNCPSALFRELTSLLTPWLRKSGKSTTATTEPQRGPSPMIAVDFQPPRITVALGTPSGGRKTESWPETDLPPEMAPLIKRARELAGRPRDAARPGSYIRIEPAMVQRVADLALEASDLTQTSPIAAALLTPWRFTLAPEPFEVRGQVLTKEYPLFVSLAEHLYLLRAYKLAPTPSEPSSIPGK